ncbi:hypothetical protein BDZ89DRAFT_1041183 [Hymenopellis radicata]|nr:hypothetical protein BDZ89DRAFT_1041183 [Hymenopellis radicata]
MAFTTSVMAMRAAEHLHDLAGRGSKHRRLRKIPKSRHEQARRRCRESQEGAFQADATSESIMAKSSPAEATATAGSSGKAQAQDKLTPHRVRIAFTYLFELTHYIAGLRAYGNTNTSDDFIAAVTDDLYDSYPGGERENDLPYDRGGSSPKTLTMRVYQYTKMLESRTDAVVG